MTQAELRNRRVGDIPVEQQVVTVDELMRAIEQQARMPMVRIGEALLALEMVTPSSWTSRWSSNAMTDRCRWASCWSARESSRARPLQSTLARKMGYRWWTSKLRRRARCGAQAVPYAVALRLQVLPLAIADGRLVVAMEDHPARRALDELEFITQLKIVC